MLDSEDESSVLMDCCLFDWIHERKNLIEKYAENHPPAPGTEEHELLEAYRQAKYRIVVPQSRVPPTRRSPESYPDRRSTLVAMISPGLSSCIFC